jgi:MFS family permease
MLESPITLVRRLPAQVRILLFGTLVNKIGTFIVPYLSLVLHREFHLSAAASGALVSTYGVGALVSILVGGVLTDSLGRRVVLLLSLGGSGALALAMAFAPSVNVFVVLLVAFGFLAELYRPASSAIISDLLPSSERATGYAALRVVVNLGFALGIALGGLVVDWSWRALYAADGATTLVFGAVVFASIGESKPVPSDHLAPAREEKVGLWRDGVYAQALMTSLAFSFVVFNFITVLPLTVTLWAGYPAAIYGAIVALNGVLIALFEVSMVAWLQRFRRLRVAALGLVVSAIGFALTGLVPHWSWFLVSVAVWTFGEMMTLPQQMAFLADWAPPAARGRYMGLYAATWSVGFALNPVVMLPLHAWAGERAFWGLMLVALVPAALVPWRLDRVADRPERLRGVSEPSPDAALVPALTPNA